MTRHQHWKQLYKVYQTKWDRRAGTDTQSKVEIEVKLDQMGARTDAIQLELEHAKRSEETHYHSTQMQLAAIQDRPSGTGSSSGGSREPLITHKLMMNENKLNGSENSSTIEDWFDLITMEVNLIYPGSKSILDWCSQQSTEITAFQIQQRHDASLASK